MLCAVLCYICCKNMRKVNKYGQQNRLKSWSQRSEKMQKITGNIGKLIKTWSLFLARYGHPRTQKRSKIGHFPQRIVFTFPLGFADDFGPRS